MFPDFCGLELKKRLPNALYRIAWHGALNRVTITRCKTRKVKFKISCAPQKIWCPMLLQWLNTVIHLHSSLLPSIYLSVSELHLQHTFTIRDGSLHFPYLENFKMAVMHLPDKQFGKDWAPKRWADLEVDPNSFSSYPRPNHAGLPGLPWGDTLAHSLKDSTNLSGSLHATGIMFHLPKKFVFTCSIVDTLSQWS